MRKIGKLRLCEAVDSWLKEQLSAANAVCDVYGYMPVIHRCRDRNGKILGQNHYYSCSIIEAPGRQDFHHAYIDETSVELLIDPAQDKAPAGIVTLQAADPLFFEKLTELLKVTW